MSETEGIVLSPQRRSFITGCQVSKEPKDSEGISNSSNAKSGSVSASSSEAGGSSLRPDSMSNSNRRVGSGRLRPSAPPSSEDYDGPRRNYGDSGPESRYGFNRGDRDRGNLNVEHNPEKVLQIIYLGTYIFTVKTLGGV